MSGADGDRPPGLLPEKLSLGEAAYRWLRGEIVSCRMLPGQRLTERQLACDTGYGGSPLREALTRLDHDGLVRTLPRKGYQVTPMTPQSIDDLLDAWSIVGPELVRRGVGRASAAQRSRLAEGFDAVARVGRNEPGQETAQALIDLLEDIFGTLAAAAGNDYLLTLYLRMAGDLARVWRLVLAADPGLAEIGAVDFWTDPDLIGQDGEAAAASARRIIAHARDRASRLVAAWPSVRGTEMGPFAPPA